MPRTRKTKQRKKGRMEAVAKGEQRKEDEATMVAWPNLADFGEGDVRCSPSLWCHTQTFFFPLLVFRRVRPQCNRYRTPCATLSPRVE
jgi:hypothetical protein